MGKRGPKPKPIPLRVFEGNPGHLLINKDSPQPKGKAIPPRSLKDEPLTIWNDEAPGLEAIGLLTKSDARAFSNYCKIAAMCDAAYEIRDLNMFLRLADAQRKHGSDFGMSPASRVGLKVDGRAKETDELDEFKRSG